MFAAADFGEEGAVGGKADPYQLHWGLGFQGALKETRLGLLLG